MKKILLIGDSIRIGYDRYVKMAFEGEAQVYYPDENCRFTGYIMRNLHLWQKELGCGSDIDLVHWNAGLWDDLLMLDGKPHTPLHVYRENISRICDFIGILFPNAKMLFATSTPVRNGDEAGKPLWRCNADTEAYNAAAAETVLAHGGEIDDLYAVAARLPDEAHSDDTHYYTPLGTEALAGAVISAIAGALGIPPRPLDYAALFTEAENVIGH